MDRLTYLTKLTVEHLDSKHPGPIANEKLLKDFSKYIRIDDESDSSNFVIRNRYRETIHFKLINKQVWDMLHDEFGGITLQRDKDQSHFSYFSPKYKVKHDCLKVFLLPPWNKLS